MNNQQFRRLVLDVPPGGSSSSSSAGEGARAVAAAAAAKANGDGGGSSINHGHGLGHGHGHAALGSRTRANIPMTPRHVGVGSTASDLFARQLREKQEEDKNKNGHKAGGRASAAPKGSRLANGYTDRAQLLRTNADGEGGEQDDKKSRVTALEEMLKLGQMDQATFVRLRDEIVGGQIENVHLVKGLDRRLLARARAGEDVYSKPEPEEAVNDDVGDGEGAVVGAEEVEDELDDLLIGDVTPMEREAREKRGKLAAPGVTGRKRTRDDILRELKEARLAAAADKQQVAKPTLGAHFKKINVANQPGTSRVEIDEYGREVLIVVDTHGNVKRKIKKSKQTNGKDGASATALPMPDKDAKPLGMDVPELPPARTAPVEEENDDIFSDAGSDYNPLGQAAEDSADSDSDVDEIDNKTEHVNEDIVPDRQSAAKAALPSAEEQTDKLPATARNYFRAGDSSHQSTSNAINPLSDPSILSAIRKAGSSRVAEKAVHRRNASPGASDDDDDSNDRDEDEAGRLAKIRARLSERDRDEDDLDMGFGTSRFEDDEDGEGRPVKLARWKGLLGAADTATDDMDDDDDEGDGGARGGQGQRKRGGGGGGSGGGSGQKAKKKKKKGGDKNDAATVLGVLESRRGGG